MPSRRSQVEMSPAEIRAFLRSNTRIILVTNGPGGFPHPMPMNYTLDDEDRIVMTAFTKSQKVLNLRRDPRTALLVETGAVYSDLKSVVAYANAEIIEGADKVLELLPMLAAAPTGDMQGSAQMAAQLRASVAKRVVLRFKPTRYVSWDHGKLKGFY